VVSNINVAFDRPVNGSSMNGVSDGTSDGKSDAGAFDNMLVATSDGISECVPDGSRVGMLNGTSRGTSDEGAFGSD